MKASFLTRLVLIKPPDDLHRAAFCYVEIPGFDLFYFSYLSYLSINELHFKNHHFSVNFDPFLTRYS